MAILAWSDFSYCYCYIFLLCRLPSSIKLCIINCSVLVVCSIAINEMWRMFWSRKTRIDPASCINIGDGKKKESHLMVRKVTCFVQTRGNLKENCKRRRRKKIIKKPKNAPFQSITLAPFFLFSLLYFSLFFHIFLNTSYMLHARDTTYFRLYVITHLY